MFGRKKDDAEEARPAADEQGEPPLPLKSRIRDRIAPTPPPRTPVGRPEIVRRPPDIHGGPHRGLDRGRGGENDGKRLIVGRDIALNGQINSCDKLVVEGRVEANMSDCREIEIAETGTFKGEAEIDLADISGTFDGSLTARQLLIVRSTGRITGKVRFGQLEIERGGEIVGDVQTYSASEAHETAPMMAADTPAE